MPMIVPPTLLMVTVSLAVLRSKQSAPTDASVASGSVRLRPLVDGTNSLIFASVVASPAALVGQYAVTSAENEISTKLYSLGGTVSFPNTSVNVVMSFP